MCVCIFRSAFAISSLWTILISKWFANSINVDCRNEINTQFNVATSECRMLETKAQLNFKPLELVLHWEMVLVHWDFSPWNNGIGGWRVQWQRTLAYAKTLCFGFFSPLHENNEIDSVSTEPEYYGDESGGHEMWQFNSRTNNRSIHLMKWSK